MNAKALVILFAMAGIGGVLGVASPLLTKKKTLPPPVQVEEEPEPVSPEVVQPIVSPEPVVWPQTSVLGGLGLAVKDAPKTKVAPRTPPTKSTAASVALLKEWTISASQPAGPLGPDFADVVNTLHFSPEGDRLFVANQARATRWDWSTAKPMESLSAPKSATLVASPDCRYLALFTGQEIQFYDLYLERTTGSVKAPGFTRFVHPGSFGPTGAPFLQAVSDKNELSIWSIKPETAQATRHAIKPLKEVMDSTRSTLLSAGAGRLIYGEYYKRLASSTTASVVQKIDPRDGTAEPLKSLTVNSIKAVARRTLELSTDSKWLLSFEPGTLQVCDPVVDRLAFQKTETNWVFHLPKFSPDGNQVMAVRYPTIYYLKVGYLGAITGMEYLSPTLTIWNIRQQKQLASLELRQIEGLKRIDQYALSPDGTKFAIADGLTIRVFDFHKLFGLESPRSN
jgi:WD40 repeat protein